MKNENEKEKQQETLETSESFSSVEVIYVEGVDKPSPKHVDCLLISLSPKAHNQIRFNVRFEKPKKYVQKRLTKKHHQISSLFCDNFSWNDLTGRTGPVFKASAC